MRSSLVLLVLVITCLAGCGTVPPPVPVVQILTPPDSLLQDCVHAPRPDGVTVLDLAQGVVNERAVVETCDWSDKAALRAWKAGATASAIQK
jgi:hypothetical protein